MKNSNYMDAENNAYLNERALRYRNSKEYMIGERMIRYFRLIKKLKFISLFNQLGRDLWRVVILKKTIPQVNQLDINKLYYGKRIAVYTAVYGNYDKIEEPLFTDPFCDYFIFTDLKVPATSVWKKIDYENFPENINSDFLKNRYVKMMPHKIFKEYEYSIYIDGNIKIVSVISSYCIDMTAKSGISMHAHPINRNIFEEITSNLRLGKITKSEAKSLKARFKRENVPYDYGMFECNVIVRNHFDINCIKIMEFWWEELLFGVKRDQLYFTYVLWKQGYDFSDVKLIGPNINTNPMFIRMEHTKC